MYYCGWHSVKPTLTLIRHGGVSLVTFACILMNLIIWSVVPSHGHMANQLLVSSLDHYRGGVGMRPTKCKPPCPIRFSKCKLLGLAGTLLPSNCKTANWFNSTGWLQFPYMMASRTKWFGWIGFPPLRGFPLRWELLSGKIYWVVVTSVVITVV